MNKPSSLSDICYHLYESSDKSNYVRIARKDIDPDDAVDQIRELAQSVLREYYKDNHLGREGIKILNELHERLGKL